MLKRGRSRKFNEGRLQHRGERGNNLTRVMTTASYVSESQHQLIKLMLKCIVNQDSLVCYPQKDFHRV